VAPRSVLAAARGRQTGRHGAVACAVPAGRASHHPRALTHRYCGREHVDPLRRREGTKKHVSRTPVAPSGFRRRSEAGRDEVRALLVEDDATIADFGVRGLREAGLAVDHRADGDEGLSAAATGSYDVAIVDLMLPKRDGLALIEELRRRSVTTPVL